MHEKKFTIFGSHATKSAVERAAEIIFTACGLLFEHGLQGECDEP